jgi:arylsulfatase A-like enzyme
LRSKFAVLAPIAALVLGSSIPQQACKAPKEGTSLSRIKRKAFYHDLVLDIAAHGKTSLAQAEEYPQKKVPRKRRRLVCSLDIRPVDMGGAVNFEAKSFDILMSVAGTISQKLRLPAGKNRITVQARGESSDGEKARMRVMVDETELGTVDVPPESEDYVFPMELKKGRHQIHVSFVNGNGDRKLVLSNIQVRRVVVDSSGVLQDFVASRLLDDTLNEVKGTAVIVMGKIDSVSRRSLFMPSPSLAEVRLEVPQNAFLQFAAGIDERVWRNRLSGCEFLASFIDDAGSHVLYEDSFRPYEKKEDRVWRDVEIDLSKFQNRKGILRFETKPLPFEKARGGTSLGYLLLANPRIVSSSSPKEPNIILISIDTLRRDHLGLYGYAREVSPFLDRMAEETAVFDRALAQAPYTVTSHMTMITSLWPRVHQILTHVYQDRLSTKWLTLAQILKARGYMTAGFTAGGQVSAVYGFDRGMDVYDYQGGISEIIFPKAIGWMARTRGNPFFLFLHTYDPHMPYEPPAPYDTIFDPDYKGNISRWTEENVEITDPELFNRIVELYDGEIRYVDSQLQRVIGFLKDAGLYENTLIIVTSDHGEEFMEHGTMAYHSHTLYNELLLVPLFIRFPGGKWGGRRIQEAVALNDLMPTVLDYLELPFPAYCQGESLLTYLKRKSPVNPGRKIFSERITKRDDPQVDICVQSLSEKYCQNAYLSDEYFDLAGDPGEKSNILESHKMQASELLKEIREYFSSYTELAKLGLEDGGSRRQVMDKETVEKLKALGYIK